MTPWQILWTDEIIAHLQEHGVSPEDFEWVFEHSERIGKSRSSGRPCKWGFTIDGRYLIIIYEPIDADTILPVTAFEVAEP